MFHKGDLVQFTSVGLGGWIKTSSSINYFDGVRAFLGSPVSIDNSTPAYFDLPVSLVPYNKNGQFDLNTLDYTVVDQFTGNSFKGNLFLEFDSDPGGGIVTIALYKNNVLETQDATNLTPGILEFNKDIDFYPSGLGIGDTLKIKIIVNSTNVTNFTIKSKPGKLTYLEIGDGV